MFKSEAQNEPKPKDGQRLYPKGYLPFGLDTEERISIPFNRNSRSTMFRLRTEEKIPLSLFQGLSR